MRARVAVIVALFALVLAPAACGAAGAQPAPPTTAAATAPASGDFTVSSSAVADGKLLPEFKCERKVNGVEESIPLAWSNVPESARSLAVIMYHYPDANDHTRVNSYLLLWGIDPSVTEIPSGAADDGPWFMGANKDGVAISYTSPCSKGAGTHEYTITVYALSDFPPSLPRENSLGVSYDVLRQAMDTVTIVDTASLAFTSITP